MREQDYKSEDIEEVIELKGMALKQLEAIERCIWTDNVNEATARITHLYQCMQRVRVMKNAKTDERNFSYLLAKLSAMGVNAHSIKFVHKKTD
ncbi:hypothetical protein [Sporosarcina sp. ITBMC105]